MREKNAMRIVGLGGILIMIIGLWSIYFFEEIALDSDMPCYDKYDNIIEGVVCSDEIIEENNSIVSSISAMIIIGGFIITLISSRYLIMRWL